MHTNYTMALMKQGVTLLVLNREMVLVAVWCPAVNMRHPQTRSLSHHFPILSSQNSKSNRKENILKWFSRSAGTPGEVPLFHYICIN